MPEPAQPLGAKCGRWFAPKHAKRPHRASAASLHLRGLGVFRPALLTSPPNPPAPPPGLDALGAARHRQIPLRQVPPPVATLFLSPLTSNHSSNVPCSNFSRSGEVGKRCTSWPANWRTATLSPSLRSTLIPSHKEAALTPSLLFNRCT